MLRTTTIGVLASLAYACGFNESPDALNHTSAPLEYDPTYIFDPGEVRTYEFTIDPDDWQCLQDDPAAEEYAPATMHFNGITIENVGLRFKGAYGALGRCTDEDGRWLRDKCPKLSMKASFNEYVKGRTWSGLKKLQFHSMHHDDTKMVEHLSYRLFRDMGVFAPRTAYARLVINGEFQGLYVLVEQIDGRFTREHFPDGGKGNLYKEVWPVHDTEGPYREALRTNEDDVPPVSVDKMIRFAHDIKASDENTFAQTLERWTDVDMYINYMAVSRAIEHWDDITTFYCDEDGDCDNHNYYWYESTDEDKIWLIPWDLDGAMRWPPLLRTVYDIPDWDEAVPCDLLPFDDIYMIPPSCDHFIDMTAAALWDRYARATQTFLVWPFTRAEMDARMDVISVLISQYIEEDPHLDYSEWGPITDQLRLDLDSMRAYIANKVQP